MPNMRPDKNPMPHQDPQVRAGNFSEVALGYTREQAMDEDALCGRVPGENPHPRVYRQGGGGRL